MAPQNFNFCFTASVKNLPAKEFVARWAPGDLPGAATSSAECDSPGGTSASECDDWDGVQCKLLSNRCGGSSDTPDADDRSSCT